MTSDRDKIYNLTRFPVADHLEGEVKDRSALYRKLLIKPAYDSPNPAPTLFLLYQSERIPHIPAKGLLIEPEIIDLMRNLTRLPLFLPVLSGEGVVIGYRGL